MAKGFIKANRNIINCDDYMLHKHEVQHRILQATAAILTDKFTNNMPTLWWSVWSGMMERMVDDYMKEMASHNSRFSQYWRDADHSMIQVANEAHQVVDDDKKFAVSIDVSQFKPEELKVNLDGRVVTVEGKQERKDDKSFMSRFVVFLYVLQFENFDEIDGFRSFVRSWTLPNDVNTDAIQTELDDKGTLTIEAPKSGCTLNKIPIMPPKGRHH
ncbi:hypothetical protein KIN20_036893 [Parelaphostrongylus tenuis]|uniref:SHSP domain-containing protein n=1 Tax=Parelaphostrongylus tenuis TaxID=148309 RepID=A0AAD5RE04_PARTN|nr:hypothetical protein KIN20_036893 [Parelaphostrongylus tenuis]